MSDRAFDQRLMACLTPAQQDQVKTRMQPLAAGILELIKSQEPPTDALALIVATLVTCELAKAFTCQCIAVLEQEPA